MSWDRDYMPGSFLFSNFQIDMNFHVLTSQQLCWCQSLTSCHLSCRWSVNAWFKHIVNSTLSQQLRSSGIRCRWSDDVHHSAKWAARCLCQHSSLRMIVEDTSFLSTLVMSHVMCDINLCYLLTYLLTYLSWELFACALVVTLTCYGAL